MNWNFEKILIESGLFILLFTLTACDCQYHLSGVVLDKLTLKPIEGVAIGKANTTDRNNPSNRKKMTMENGGYEIYGIAGRCDEITMFFTKDGYVTQKNIFPNNSIDTILLQPTRKKQTEIIDLNTDFEITELTKDRLHKELNDHSFIWKIGTKDTTISMDVHFSNDSIYVLESEKNGQNFAHFGYWKIFNDPDSKALHLNMNDIINEFSPKVTSWSNDTLQLTHGNAIYEAVKKEIDEVDYANLLIGSWVARKDSIINAIPEFNKTGKFLTNPTFKFDQDSFRIRTDGFIRKGKYRVLKNSNYVVLETSKTYWRNFVLIIESAADPSKLEIRFKQGSMGNWKSYVLERDIY